MSGDDRKPWIMQAPVLSTAHLSEEVGEKLAQTLPGEDLFGFVCMIGPDGGLVYFGDPDSWIDEPEEKMPACLRDCATWANNEGYEWVRFDSSGDVVEGLPVYEW